MVRNVIRGMFFFITATAIIAGATESFAAEDKINYSQFIPGSIPGYLTQKPPEDLSEPLTGAAASYYKDNLTITVIVRRIKSKDDRKYLEDVKKDCEENECKTGKQNGWKTQSYYWRNYLTPPASETTANLYHLVLIKRSRLIEVRLLNAEPFLSPYELGTIADSIAATVISNM